MNREDFDGLKGQKKHNLDKEFVKGEVLRWSGGHTPGGRHKGDLALSTSFLSLTAQKVQTTIFLLSFMVTYTTSILE